MIQEFHIIIEVHSGHVIQSTASHSTLKPSTPPLWFVFSLPNTQTRLFCTTLCTALRSSSHHVGTSSVPKQLLKGTRRTRQQSSSKKQCKDQHTRVIQTSQALYYHDLPFFQASFYHYALSAHFHSRIDMVSCC
jgi:hypothetical protein